MNNKTNPPPDCSQEELFAFIESLHDGDRVIEKGRSGLTGRVGTVVWKNRQACIRWDELPGEGGVMTTSFTGGARLLPDCNASFDDRPAHKGYPRLPHSALITDPDDFDYPVAAVCPDCRKTSPVDPVTEENLATVFSETLRTMVLVFQCPFCGHTDRPD